jgi:hypothetical protein
LGLRFRSVDLRHAITLASSNPDHDRRGRQHCERFSCGGAKFKGVELFSSLRC